jgi:hypothetical protein
MLQEVDSRGKFDYVPQDEKIACQTRLFKEKQVVALNFFQIIEIFLTNFASCNICYKKLIQKKNQFLCPVI